MSFRGGRGGRGGGGRGGGMYNFFLLQHIYKTAPKPKLRVNQCSYPKLKLSKRPG